ncbi:MAG: flavin reductase family protein, partial [Actinomycetota bacterium]|nr:flavin reductase family protein [Actinomycetota bacterium]
MADIDSGVFRNVLGHFPTGVTAVTAVNDGKPVGMAIGSFTSVSLEPPLVAFLPGKESGSWKEIREAGSFCVNVMGQDQMEVCGVMASRAEDKFADVEWSPAGS